MRYCSICKISKFPGNILSTAALLLCATSAVSAPETPWQIYQYAVGSDPTLGAATSAYQARVENAKGVRGSLYPQIDITARAASNREDVEIENNGVGVSDLSRFSSHNAQLRINQALYRKDLTSKIDIADAQREVAESEHKSAQQNLIMRVIVAYFDVLMGQDNLAFTDAEKEAIDSQLQIVEQRYDVGKSTLTDLQEARASYALSEAELYSAQDDYVDSLEGLSELTGRQHSEVAGLSSSFAPGTLEHAELEYWINLAENNNPQLMAARQTLQTLQHEIRLKRAEHYPTLDLVARYGDQATGGRFGDSETADASIGVELVIPIYSGGQTSSSVRSAHHKLSEAEYNLAKTHRAVVREIQRSHRTVKTSLNRIEARERAAESAETALTMIKTGYDVGTRTSTDVLDAQREVFMAKRDYLADKYSYIMNYLQLKNLTGTLSENDLTMINDWFEED